MFKIFSLVFLIFISFTSINSAEINVFEFTDLELSKLEVRKVRGAENNTIYSVGSNKNGNYLNTVNGNQREYADSTSPGTYLYEIKTLWNGADTSLLSEPASITASTFLLDFSYIPKINKIDFVWNPCKNENCSDY